MTPSRRFRFRSSISWLSLAPLFLLSPVSHATDASPPLNTPPPIVTADPPPAAPSSSGDLLNIAPPPPPSADAATPKTASDAKPEPIEAEPPPANAAPSSADSSSAPPAPLPPPLGNVPHPDLSGTEEIPPPAPTVEAEQQPTVISQAHAPYRGDRTWQLKRPWLGTQLLLSPSALGKTDLSGGESVSAKGVELGFEYQPTSIQAIGVLAFGPTFNLYPIYPSNPSVVTGNTNSSIWSIGGQIRYQARFFREQVLVPMVGYDYERVSYHLTNIQGSTLNLNGPVVGMYLLLNTFEPDASFSFYDSASVLRSYFVGEIHSLKGTNTNLSITGTSYFLGLRFEFD